MTCPYRPVRRKPSHDLIVFPNGERTFAGLELVEENTIAVGELRDCAKDDAAARPGIRLCHAEEIASENRFDLCHGWENKHSNRLNRKGFSDTCGHLKSGVGQIMGKPIIA